MKLLAIFVAALFAATAHAALLTNPNDPRTWQGASVSTFANLFGITNQEVINRGLLDDSHFDITQGSPAAMITAPNSNQLCGYQVPTQGDPYNYVVGQGCTAQSGGNAIDNFWTHLIGGNGDAPGEYVWRLQAPSTKAAVFPAVDHGPLPQEAMEATVYLGKSATGPWVPAEIQRVWLEGFVPDHNIKWDGFTYAVGFPGNSDTFTHVSLKHGGGAPYALLGDGDAEINGVMGLDDSFEPPIIVDKSCSCKNAEASSSTHQVTLEFSEDGSSC
jgi:hypothetical protein